MNSSKSYLDTSIPSLFHYRPNHFETQRNKPSNLKIDLGAQSFLNTSTNNKIPTSYTMYNKNIKPSRNFLLDKVKFQNYTVRNQYKADIGTSLELMNFKMNYELAQAKLQRLDHLLHHRDDGKIISKPFRNYDRDRSTDLKSSISSSYHKDFSFSPKSKYDVKEVSSFTNKHLNNSKDLAWKRLGKPTKPEVESDQEEEEEVEEEEDSESNVDLDELADSLIKYNKDYAEVHKSSIKDKSAIPTNIRLDSIYFQPSAQVEKDGTLQLNSIAPIEHGHENTQEDNSVVSPIKKICFDKSPATNNLVDESNHIYTKLIQSESPEDVKNSEKDVQVPEAIENEIKQDIENPDKKEEEGGEGVEKEEEIKNNELENKEANCLNEANEANDVLQQNEDQKENTSEKCDFNPNENADSVQKDNPEDKDTLILETPVPEDKPKFNLKLEEKKLNENNMTCSEISSARKKVTFTDNKKVINYGEKNNVKNFLSDIGEPKQIVIEGDYMNRSTSSKSKKKKVKSILVKKNFGLENLPNEEEVEKTEPLPKKKKFNPIIQRHIREIKEMENLVKETGKKRVSKEKKKELLPPKKLSLCKKFKKNPLKFFTSPIKTREIEGLEIKGIVPDRITLNNRDHNERLCLSERAINHKKDAALEIIHSLKYDNLTREEKQYLLKEMVHRLNMESCKNIRMSESKDDNIINISFISEDESQMKSKESVCARILSPNSIMTNSITDPQSQSLVIKNVSSLR